MNDDSGTRAGALFCYVRLFHRTGDSLPRMRSNSGSNWVLWPYMCNYAPMMETGLNGACIRLCGMVPRICAAVAPIIALNGFTCRDGINARLRRFRAYVGRVVLYMAMCSGGMPSD